MASPVNKMTPLPNANDPLAPRFTDLVKEAGNRDDHTPSEAMQEAGARLDAFAAKLGGSLDPVPVLDFKFPPGATLRLGLGVNTLRWPAGLFIPGDADYKQYWFVPPAEGTHRYMREWVSGNASDADHAHAATGELFAYAAGRPTDRQLRSEAGIGFVFTPQLTLATYAIEVAVNLLAQDRYDVSTTVAAGGCVREWGGLYTAAWEISPVDGSLSLVHPFGIATLFNQTFENLTGSPITNFPRVGPLTANIMLQGSRSYLIGVIAAVQIDNTWVMSNGAPMQPLPDGSTWKVWCAITGTIPQVWITPSTVYIP